MLGGAGVAGQTEMNDPHVKALIYHLRHGEYVDYRRAGTLLFERPGFSGRTANDKVRFEMIEHFATERLARDSVEPFIRGWEFHACIQHGPDHLDLEFEDSEIVDCKPTPDVHVHSARVRVGSPPVTAQVKVNPASYPSPREGDLNVDHPDVQTLYQRYQGYKAERERLGSFANFCLTVLENSVRGTESRRAEAAKKYDVAKAVLNQIGKLCNERGGGEARKGKGVAKPFTVAEKQFLESAVKRLIYRVAEHHGSNGAALPSITLAEVEAGSD